MLILERKHLAFPLLLLPFFAGGSLAQVDVGTANIAVQSNEIKPWPNYDCHGNGFNNLDAAVSDDREVYAIVVGHDGNSPCGPVLGYVGPFSSSVAAYTAIHVDGAPITWPINDPGDRLGKVIREQPTGSGGFGNMVAVGGGRQLAWDAFSFTAFQMADLALKPAQSSS